MLSEFFVGEFVGRGTSISTTRAWVDPATKPMPRRQDKSTGPMPTAKPRPDPSPFRRDEVAKFMKENESRRTEDDGRQIDDSVKHDGSRESASDIFTNGDRRLKNVSQVAGVMVAESINRGSHAMVDVEIESAPFQERLHADFVGGVEDTTCPTTFTNHFESEFDKGETLGIDWGELKFGQLKGVEGRSDGLIMFARGECPTDWTRHIRGTHLHERGAITQVHHAVDQ